MKKIAFFICFFISVFVLPAMLYAEIREGSFEVNPYVGYYFPSGDHARPGRAPGGYSINLLSPPPRGGTR